jgi:flavin reductase (DIM6/NTAB) family NADH-FMN oxidoreductase RutF
MSCGSGTLIDPLRLRAVFGAFPTGVTTVAGLVDGEPIGLAASSFTTVSLDPPLVSVCVGAGSSSWPYLAGLPRIGISVLAEHHEEVSRAMTRAQSERFAGVPWRATDDGAVLLSEAVAWLDCSIYAEYPAGDHTIIVLAVHDVDADHTASPLVFHGSAYRTLSPELAVVVADEVGRLG